MTQASDQAVVVGVDLEGTSGSAVDWAAQTAVLTDSPLLLLHSEEWLAGLPGADALGADLVLQLDTMRQIESEGENVLRAALEGVKSTHPDLEVRLEHIVGSAAGSLLERQDRASLLVVGAGGKSATARFFLGTTSLSVIAHARRPVAVIPQLRPEPAPRGRIAVALDGGEDSPGVLAIALEQARIRTLPLSVVTCWYVEVVDGYVVTEEGSAEWRAVEQSKTAMIQQLLDQQSEAARQVQVDIQVVRAPTVQHLVGVSGQVDLLVLGSRGRGGFVGKLLGSVSQKVVRSAVSPVIVAPASD